MFYLILTLLVIDALILAVVVLMQAGQDGGLASLGGGPAETMLGGRQAVTLLTRASWWCGGIFMFLSLVLSIMSAGRSPSGETLNPLQERLRQTAPAPAAAPAQLPLTGAPAPQSGAQPAPAGQQPAPANPSPARQPAK